MAEESEGGTAARPVNAELQCDKKQYTSPVLRRLGTVRELTMGSHHTQTNDARSGKFKM